VGKEEGGLFYLMQQPKVSPLSSFSISSCNSTIKTSSHDVWHYRLGHPSESRMQSLHHSFPEISCINKDFCYVCPLAKQHRIPFPVHTTHTRMPFEIVHCDIWGPMATPSINGSVFFLSIVDDYTRFTWVHLMKSKSQTRSLIKSFFSLVQTQFNLKIKCLRSDNGSEFKMHDFFFF
jgi:transposase InsO family protein